MRVLSHKILIAVLICLQGCFSSSPDNGSAQQSRGAETSPIPSISVEAQELETVKLSMVESGVAIDGEDFLEIVDSVELSEEERELLSQLLQ